MRGADLAGPRRAAGSLLLICAAVVVPVAGWELTGRLQRSDAVTGAAAVHAALDRGAYEDADRLASDLVANAERLLGTESVGAADALDLLVEARL
jgi:hypothetical protein